MVRYDIKYSDFHILPVDPPTRCLQLSFRRASLAPGISDQPRLLFLTSPLSVCLRGCTCLCAFALLETEQEAGVCVLIAGEIETMGAETEVMHEDEQLSHTGK